MSIEEKAEKLIKLLKGTEEKAKKLDEIIDMLNNDSSISLMAYDYNVVYCVQELIELYQDAESRLQEVDDTVRWR